MPRVSAPTPEEAVAKLEAEAQAKALVAFAAGCRLAIRPYAATNCRGCVISYEFVVLSPGEQPEGAGWTLYEQRGDQAVGRLA